MKYIDNKLKFHGYFKTEQEAIEAVKEIRANHQTLEVSDFLNFQLDSKLALA